MLTFFEVGYSFDWSEVRLRIIIIYFCSHVHKEFLNGWMLTSMLVTCYFAAICSVFLMEAYLS